MTNPDNEGNTPFDFVEFKRKLDLSTLDEAHATPEKGRWPLGQSALLAVLASLALYGAAVLVGILFKELCEPFFEAAAGFFAGR